MKQLPMCLSVVSVLFLLTFGSLHLSAQRRHKGCPANIQPDVLETEIDRAASGALDAIKSGKPEKLMPLLAERGVILGVDGPLVNLTAIRKQMANKTGIYCVIFDATCLRREVKKAGAKLGEEEILSIRDHVLRPKHAIETRLAAEPPFCGGTTSDGSPIFDLEWERTSNGWKIVAIPYL